MFRDRVLEGVRSGELEALSLIAEREQYWPQPDLRIALLSKGWVEQFGATLVLTITGRTLLSRH